jgi:hypothetical protein
MLTRKRMSFLCNQQKLRQGCRKKRPLTCSTLVNSPENRTKDNGKFPAYAQAKKGAPGSKLPSRLNQRTLHGAFVRWCTGRRRRLLWLCLEQGLCMRGYFQPPRSTPFTALSWVTHPVFFPLWLVLLRDPLHFVWLKHWLSLDVIGFPALHGVSIIILPPPPFGRSSTQPLDLSYHAQGGRTCQVLPP